ncbi:MAG: hypothetical protein ACRCYR_18215 [Phycicoccus sp.]
MQTRPNRRLLRGLVATMAGAASVVAAAAPAPARPDDAQAAAPSTFRVAQFNLQRDDPKREQVADLEDVLPLADLVHVNEGSGALDAVRDYTDRNPDEWHVYTGEDGTAGHQEEILMARRSEFTVESGRSGTVGFCDLNGSRAPFPKVVNWRIYTHIDSGRKVAHLGVHLPPGIEEAGRPVGEGTDKLACALDELAWIKRKVVDLSGPLDSRRVETVVTGDLNIDADADRRVSDPRFPFVRFDERDRGTTEPTLRSNWARFGTAGYPDTHTNRKIDYVYLWKRADHVRVLEMDRQQVITGLNSDHNAVVVTMGIASS